MARFYRPAVVAAGLPEGLRFHDLRHTAASLAIAAGANVLVVSKMLGHADPSITLKVYSHLFPSDLAAVAERLDAIHTVATETGPRSGANVGQVGTVRTIAAGQSP